MVVTARARLWFALNALVVAVGVVTQVSVTVRNPGVRFPTDWQRGLNVFAFFTIQSNLIVGGTTLWLALGRARPSLAFRTLRLIGVVGITLTFIVFQVALRKLQDLTGQAAFADFLLHTACPVLCVTGWLVFGPRRQTTARVVWGTLIFLIGWGTFTLIRGAVIDWYPYPFMDVVTHGYARVAVNLTLVAAVFVALSAGAHLLDGRLAPRGSRTPAAG